MDHYNWAAIQEEKMNALVSRWVIHTPHMTVARMWLGKEAIVPWHHQPNELLIMVKSGLLQFETQEKQVLVRPGEALVIPPSVAFRVEALEESMATAVFTPAREDWIRGDDAYLRR